MIPVKLKKLIEEYCMGMTPTDAQMDKINDLSLELEADPDEVVKYIEELMSGPTKEEREAIAKAEAERKAKAEAERKAKAEAERKAKAEAERKAKEEAERKAKAEAERKAKAEAERKAREEAERKAREEAERKAKAKVEAERKAKAEAERIAEEKAAKKIKRNLWISVAIGAVPAICLIFMGLGESQWWVTAFLGILVGVFSFLGAMLVIHGDDSRIKMILFRSLWAVITAVLYFYFNEDFLTSLLASVYIGFIIVGLVGIFCKPSFLRSLGISE